MVRLGLPRVASSAAAELGADTTEERLVPIVVAPPPGTPGAEPTTGAEPVVAEPAPAAVITRIGFQNGANEPLQSGLAPTASPYDPPPPFQPPSAGNGGSDWPAPKALADTRSSAEAFFQGRPRSPESRTDRAESRTRSEKDGTTDVRSSQFGGQFGEAITDFADGLGRRGIFTSERCFDNFISPVTNPFLAEDPRAVTELRPIFMFQTIPNGNAAFLGGNAEWFGAQLRIAFSEQLSLTINKFGAIAINPGTGAIEPGGFGFSEIHLGPKFTFMRNQATSMLGAAGLLFQIPTGRASVYQDTGSLSLVPYVTFGKNFLPTSYGSFNAINTTGYSFGTDRFRTDYFYNSLHLDFDWMDRHRFYPLVELNWFAYTNSGTQRFIGTEGADLANIGSTGVGGRHNLLLAVGMRYKFSERNQIGIATEFPIINRRDMNNFRLTIDYIWRY